MNLLCTKDGINKEVYIKYFYFYETKIRISELRLICEVLTEKLKVRRLEFDGCPAIDDEKGENPSKDSKILAKALSVTWRNCNLEELHLKFILLKS